MRLFRVIPLFLLLLAYGVRGQIVIQADAGCTMACCAEFAEDGCFCEAAEPTDAPTSAPLAPAVKLASPLPAWSGEVLPRLQLQRVAAAKAMISREVLTSSEVSLPVLFCSFLIWVCVCPRRIVPAYRDAFACPGVVSETSTTRSS